MRVVKFISRWFSAPLIMWATLQMLVVLGELDWPWWHPFVVFAMWLVFYALVVVYFIIAEIVKNIGNGTK